MQLLGVGYQTIHDSDFTMCRPHGYGDYLLLLMKTDSFHVIQNEKQYYPPNSIILYDKTTPQSYGAVDGQYIDDWVHFSMDENDLLWLRRLQIPFQTMLHVKDMDALSSLIHHLSFEFYSANRNREESSILYLRLIFHKLNEFALTEELDTLPFYSKLVHLRTDIYNMPANNWCIDRIAERLSLSNSYVQHVYARLFGVSIINDVINSRISHSKKLICGTNLPIHRIAELCGYEYDVYFMRQFKARTGLTPTQYRRQETSRGILPMCDKEVKEV